jgi:hypothetical protein
MPRGGGFMGRGGFGAPMMGNHMGGMGGGAMRGGRNFTNDLYADYNGPEGSVAANGMAMGMGMGMGMGAPTMPAAHVEPSVQVMVRNVSHSSNTANATHCSNSCHGRPQTRISSSCSRRLVKSFLLRSCSRERGPRAAELFSSRRWLKRPRLARTSRDMCMAVGRSVSRSGWRW